MQHPTVVGSKLRFLAEHTRAFIEHVSSLIVSSVIQAFSDDL